MHIKKIYIKKIFKNKIKLYIKKCWKNFKNREAIGLHCSFLSVSFRYVLLRRARSHGIIIPLPWQIIIVAATSITKESPDLAIPYYVHSDVYCVPTVSLTIHYHKIIFLPCIYNFALYNKNEENYFKTRRKFSSSNLSSYQSIKLYKIFLPSVQ